MPSLIWLLLSSSAIVAVGCYIVSWSKGKATRRVYWAGCHCLFLFVPMLVHESFITGHRNYSYFLLRWLLWLPSSTAVGCSLLAQPVRAKGVLNHIVLTCAAYSVGSIAISWTMLCAMAAPGNGLWRDWIAPAISGGLAGVAGWAVLNLVDAFAAPEEDIAVVIKEPRRLDAEVADVLRRRAARHRSEDAPIVGLALSGGGIRSASFCLGFLTGLDRLGLLRSVDYLSTVSGGGWPAGAVSLELSKLSNLPTSGSLLSDKSWDSITDRFRASANYVIPGGLRFSPESMTALRHLLLGASLRFVEYVLFFIAIVTVIVNLAYGGDPETSVVRKLQNVGHKLGFIHVVPERTFLIESGLIVVLLFMVCTAVSLLVLSLVRVTALRFFIPVCRAALTLATAWVVIHDPRWGLGILVTLLMWRTSIVAVYRLAKRLPLRPIVLQVTVVSIVACLLFFNGKKWDEPRWLSDGFVAVLHAPVALADRLLWMQEGRAQLANYGKQDLALHQQEFRILQSQIQLAVFASATILLIALSHYNNPNKFGLHRYWCQRIRAAFLGELRDLDSHVLESMAKADGPIPIIGAAVNAPGTDETLLRPFRRSTLGFEFSPFYVGGPELGWVPTTTYSGLTYAAALAVSAGAINTQGGDAIASNWRVALALLNLRLGYWLPNPRYGGKDSRKSRKYALRFWVVYALREMFGLNSTGDAQIFVSDGGHHENLGLLPLFVRRCKVVICVDAAADPGWTFGHLARSTRLLRVDQRLELENFDLSRSRPSGSESLDERYVESPVTLGTVRGNGQDVRFIYVKAALIPSLPPDVLSYAAKNPLFPQQPTTDQFFDEAQFEAYRKLGEAAARRVASEVKHELDLLTSA